MARRAGVSPEETRRQLLDAAAAVFEREGYDGATVSAIATEAGLTTGAIYTHYSGKAELLVDALRAHGRRATQALAPDEQPDPREMLVALGDGLLHNGGTQSALLAESSLLARRDPDVAALLSRLLVEREDGMVGLIERAAGQASADRDAAVARMAMMLGLGSTMLADLDLPKVEPDAWAELVADVVAAFVGD